ncbi:hypothetical protein Glove_115g91 [Diversispora epigaea]|uniref:Uncharacterized protein n=1 Tax=Diversispora epigaea TaxID=1348612 RepID=A0A397J124_9GLOM|nr:hypothetical protein Glove_115g91 [Diversispora epigaea]
MQSEIDSLRQRISELEAEKVELETKNVELLKQVTEESTKRKAENAKLKARIAKLEQTAEENTELKDRITKLEQKQIQVITNEQEAFPTKDISPLIESHSYEKKGITSDPLSEIEYSFQSESSTEPETSITSLPQDIIHDDSAEILDFVEMIHKERISSEIRERNWEKKLQESHNNLTPLMKSKVSTMSTPESLDPKTVKKLWDRDQNKSQDKTSQSHKKNGTENIAQVIADGIQNNIISDSVTEISATAHRQNSDTISLLDLAQLFDKATNAKYYAIKANQDETLCWNNYGSEFVVQYNDLVKNSNGKIGEKKAKGIIYDKILEHLIIIREKRSKEMGIQLPEILRKTLCKKTQRVIKTYKLFEKIGIDKIKYLKAYSANSISELTNDQIQKIIDNISDRDEFNIEEEKSNHMTEISTTACHQNHATEIVSTSVESIEVGEKEKTLPETEVSVFPEKVSLEKLSKTISEESTDASVSSNPIHDHAYFHNKILCRYSNLYKTFITEKFDRYEIIEGSLCPVCKLDHDDEKSVKGSKNHDPRACSAIKLSKYNHYVTAFGKFSGYKINPKYLDWYAKLVEPPSSLTDKIRLILYSAYTEETGLDPWVKPESSRIEKDAEEKNLFVLWVNIQSIPSKRQFPISILLKDPEEKQQHVINTILERFPYLTLKHSFRNDYFEFNRSVPSGIKYKRSSASKIHRSIASYEHHLRSYSVLNMPFYAYTEETGLDPWVKPESSRIEKDAEEKNLFVLWVNIQSIPSKRQFPISILLKDPEEKQQHVINTILERFPYLTLKHSFRNDYFEFNRSVPSGIKYKRSSASKIHRSIASYEHHLRSYSVLNMPF